MTGSPHVVDTTALSDSGLAPGATCTVTVTFSPTAAGRASSALSIETTAVNSPTTLSVTGTGTNGPR